MQPLIYLGQLLVIKGRPVSRTLLRGNFGSSFALVGSSCSPPSTFESVAMPVVLDKARLSDAELDRIDRLRGQGKTASKILTVIKRSRETRLSLLG